jgi:hypothetical protein
MPSGFTFIFADFRDLLVRMAGGVNTWVEAS